jgi:predicted nucleotidyltransferase
MNIKEILKKIEKNFDFLKKEYQIKNIGIFGSFVRKEENKKSDIDILVEFQPESQIGFFKFIQLEKYLSELLKRKVDLATSSSLKPFIKKNVLKEIIYV